MNTGAHQAKASWNFRSQGEEKLPERRMRTRMVLTSHWPHRRLQDKKTCLQRSQGKFLPDKLKAIQKMQIGKKFTSHVSFLRRY